jgi:hypothetical protein
MEVIFIVQSQHPTNLGNLETNCITFRNVKIFKFYYFSMTKVYEGKCLIFKNIPFLV